MLQQLSINNFAIIDELKVKFDEGFSIITGETGAGKSIILGALGLILGKRADLSLLKSSEKKCIIEGDFHLDRYHLEAFFELNDLDYDINTIIRREIAPNGKSRAFINDTPVTLNILNELSEKLIDIHSQNETLRLADTKFQFQIVDALADNGELLKEYASVYTAYNTSKRALNELVEEQKEAKLQYDYNLFVFNELHEANLKPDEQQELESTLDKLNNIEAIKKNITEAIQLAERDEFGAKSILNSFKQHLLRLADYGTDYSDLLARTTSLEIEFVDIVGELERSDDAVALSPEELEKYNGRLQLIYDLQKKHNVGSNTELLEIQQALEEKVRTVDNASETVEEQQRELDRLTQNLTAIGAKIHKNRAQTIPVLVEKLESSMQSLSMPETRFKIVLTPSGKFNENGTDELLFQVATNKGSEFNNLKKVASGGEKSRIMLAIKALLSEHEQLPSIIFDEIDTGVSGEVSNKMALIMEEMSKNMQVISITHLPQIAAKGTHHYKVYKVMGTNQTRTNIKKLSEEERINELAEMLSGKELVSSAIEHAKQLLG